MPFDLDNPTLAGSVSAPPSTPHQIVLYVNGNSSAFDVSIISSIYSQANALAGAQLYDVTLIGPTPHVICREGIGFKTLPPSKQASPVSMFLATGNFLCSHEKMPLRDWVLLHLGHVSNWAAVEGGSLALAQLGVIGSRRVSLRRGMGDALLGVAPEAVIDEKALFAYDGKLWSCASGAPVIDMCLAMIEADFGRTLANNLARSLLLSGRRGGDHPQVSTVLQVQSRAIRDRELAELVEWINQNIEQRIDIPTLSERVGMSERNFHRRFKIFTGFTPADYINQVRAEHARQLMLAEVSMKEIAGRSGFTSPSMASRALRRTDEIERNRGDA